MNAGKSSLLNALVGEERALVSSEAGTTRDSVEAEVEWDGVSLRLVDTAGERFGDSSPGKPGDELERRGLELAKKRRARADAFVLVVDGTLGLGDGERALLAELSPVVVAWNKRDLSSAPPPELACVQTSARTGEGLDELKRAIVGALGDLDGESGALVVSLRQKEALDAAAAALGRATAVLVSGEPSELAAEEGRTALNELGRVTGETVEVELLDAIFSRFCIGK